MTAATKDNPTADRKDGVLVGFLVKTLITLFGGTLASTDATGYAVPGDDAAGQIFQGVVKDYVDNSAGASGEKTVELWRRGLHKMTFDTAIAITDIGANVFIVDDQTVDVAANVNNGIFCGVIAGFIDTTHAWVDIEPACKLADIATHIADGSAAHAASAISLLDSGGFTTATQVEAALAEIYPLIQVEITDPGDGVAIPVTRSGIVPMTSAGAETRTIAAPAFIGQQISLIDDVHVGNIVVTSAVAVNQTGNNTLTYGAAADACTLTAMQVAGALVWRVTYNDGVALSTV